MEDNKEEIKENKVIPKRGALSSENMLYIREHIQTQTPEEIAAAIGKSYKTVRRFAYKKNLVTKEEATPTGFRRAKAKQVLRHKEYWKDIREQFSVGESQKFEESWIDFYLDFDEDVRPGEEIQMKKYIVMEILKDRMLKQDFFLSQQIDNIKKMLEEEYAKPNKNREGIKTLNNSLEKLQNNQLTFLKEYRELTDKQKDVEKSLLISRDSRIKNVQDATQNWTSVVRLLNENAQVRDQVGKHMEIMRIAKDASKILLSDFHTYVDGSLDRPILSNDTVGE